MKQILYFLLAGLLELSFGQVFSQSSGDYRTTQTGPWDAAASWQTYSGGNWIIATVAPSSANGKITITSGHVLTCNTAITLDQVVINAGATLIISGGTITAADGPGTDIDCSGTLTLTAGALTGNGTLRFASGSVFNWTGGTLAGAGSVTISTGAAFTMSYGVHYLSDSKTINNSGTWTWTGGALYYNTSSSVITNSGTFNIYTDENVTGYNSTTASFINKAGGVINKIGSPSDDTYFYNISSFINNGTINIHSSRMRFYTNYADSGAVNIALGAHLHFTTGTAGLSAKTTINGGGSLDFDGAINTINTSSVFVNTINLSAGTLTLTRSLTRSNTTVFNVSGGTLNGGGSVSFASGSTVVWAGGIIGGSGSITVHAGGVLFLNGSTHYLSDSKVIENYGVCTWTGGQIYYYNSSSIFSNYGTFNINTDDDVTAYNSATASFLNKPGGILYKTGSPLDETYFNQINFFGNSGTINIHSGRIRLYTSVADSGAINVNQGSAIHFTGGNVTFNKGAALTGEGYVTFDGAASIIRAASISIKTINVSAGSLNLLPSLTINSGKSINFYGGILNGTGSLKFSAGSNFNWLGGTLGGTGSLNISSGAAFNMSYTTHYLTDAKTINNAGSWMWTGGALYYYNSSSMVNNSGTLHIATDDDIYGSNTDPAYFVNKATGIINKTGSPSEETSFNNISLFTNSGKINILSGKLRFFTSTLDSGIIDVGPGAHVNYSSGTGRFSGVSVIKGAGNLNFDGASDTIKTASLFINNISISSGTITLLPSLNRDAGTTFNLHGGTFNGTGSFNFDSAGVFTWTGGTIGGTGGINIRKGAEFLMKGGYHYLVDAKTINNSGRWTWTGGALYYYNGSSAINNAGTFDINTDDDVLGSGSNTAAFINQPTGIINKTGLPSGDTYFSGINSFSNSGTVNILSGSLALHINGLHNGTYKIAAGAQLSGPVNMPYTGTSFTNNGSVALSGLSFTGSGGQALKGTGKINSLSVNNAQGVTLGGTQTINTALALVKQNIILQNNDLLMNPSATLSGGNDSSYVVTNGTGSLQRRVLNDSVAILFPVGTMDSYRPVKLQLSAASASDDFKIKVLPNLYASYDNAGKPKGGIINSNVVNSSWVVTEGFTGGSNATLTLQWNTRDEASGFKRAASRAASYFDNAWNAGTSTAAPGTDSFTITRKNVTAFTAFGVLNQFVSCLNTFTTLCIGQNLSVPYTAVGAFSSGNIFTAQLSDSTGSFIAPVNIGTVASTLSGTITSNVSSVIRAASGYRIRVTSSKPSGTGPDNGSDIKIASCQGSIYVEKNHSLTDVATKGQMRKMANTENEVNVFPNPTNGRFILKVHLQETNDRYAGVEIFDTDGKRVYAEKIAVFGSEVNSVINLPGTCSSGIYTLRIAAGNEILTHKIICRRI